MYQGKVEIAGLTLDGSQTQKDGRSLAGIHDTREQLTKVRVLTFATWPHAG